MQNAHQCHCCHCPPCAMLIPMMLESVMLLKEIMKISDDSAALLVVPQVVKGHLSNFWERGVSFFEYIQSCCFQLFSYHPLFTRQTGNLGFGAYNTCPQVVPWMHSVLRLLLIVSPAQTFVNISVSDINKDRNTFLSPDNQNKHSGPHIGWISTVISSIYQFNVISLPVESHHVTKRFTWWLDEFTQVKTWSVSHVLWSISTGIPCFRHLKRVNFCWTVGESDSMQIHPLLGLISSVIHTAYWGSVVDN